MLFYPDSIEEYEAVYGLVVDPIEKIIEEVEDVEFPEEGDEFDKIVIGEEEL